ncbi:hypothetical protein Vadar_018684 [Vaccinium darrowii]|uniref:Uncharacterized protein n=1 Tax=Vaccinium darrowii TaxID=229202 RepID=A0ACB7Y1N5_9ERIC|nr:hypothetical protein Vadar_018684 [Vaccinium darrowii]
MAKISPPATAGHVDRCNPFMELEKRLSRLSKKTKGRILFALVAIASTIPVIFSGYYLTDTIIHFVRGKPAACIQTHLERDLGFAIFAFVLSLMGSIATVWRAKPLQIACMTLLVVPTVLMFAVAIIIIIGLNNFDDGKTIGADYRLDAYPQWARNFFVNNNDWGVFQRCIIREKICEKPYDKDSTIPGGCCSPPIYCGYQDVNKTWIVPNSGLYHQDINCQMWSNDKDVLCYHCDSCKAAYLNDHLAFEWVLKWGCMVFACIIWLGCFAYTFAMDDKKNNQRRQQTTHVVMCKIV